MNTDTEKQVCELCLILESNAPKQMFSGELVAEMFNQIVSGHSAASVASKHGIEPKETRIQTTQTTAPNPEDFKKDFGASNWPDSMAEKFQKGWK